MFTESPRGDKIHWSAISYQLGSQVFLVNSLLAWLAEISIEVPGQIEYGVGLTTLPANIFFWIGAYLEYLEIVNKSWPNGSLIRKDVECGHSTVEGIGGAEVPADNAQMDRQPTYDGHCQRLLWTPSFQTLTTRHMYGNNFHACIIQLVGATVFTMSGLADLPEIRDRLTPVLKVLLEQEILHVFADAERMAD